MTGTRPAEILRHLEQTETDAALLARFVATKDGAAFAELVRRHGPLVLGVCRRVTCQTHDAEDAFQATFLVLAQKAGSLRTVALLGNWLYGVAFRVASRAKRSARRRRARELTMAVLPEPAAPTVSATASDIQPILDEELAALAACYRDAIVLCDLRGTPRAEAALALGIPEGTLSSRLANGRRKLAARLSRRGVALSATTIPMAVAEVQAATSVPNELVTKTCGLVAEWATGGAVPNSVAQLTQGGAAVRKSLMFGAVMAVGLAGAVFATSSQEEPPADPQKPPLVAEKAAEQPTPKLEPKKGDKSVAFTISPKLQRSFDIHGCILTAMWNANGSHLALFGWQPVGLPGGKPRAAVVICALASKSPSIAFPDEGTELVGFAPDGLTYVTELREYQLISGHHQLKFSTLQEMQDRSGFVSINLKSTETVELELPETKSYAFAADMKTFRTVALKTGLDGEVTQREVLEVDAHRSKSVKSLLKFDSETFALSPNGKRFAVLDKDASQVTVFDLDRGVKSFDCTFPKNQDEEETPSAFRHVVFSSDGCRLGVACGQGRVYLINVDTGEMMPRLEGAASSFIYLHDGAFSADGRLLAASGMACKQIKGEPKGDFPAQQFLGRDGQFLAVWDTRTGKVLKTWSGSPLVSFCPTQPLLAILERNGESEIRVGFWDFAAEVEKK
ncbi:sigma-70 family RNA polymerase sigma factor [Frigoriglobus tundricola]|uniref:ECF RNA polymerase sigma factor SigE n=1 Tax=Frigoriglobus tundricola TaxID=2774151 RepID=A0A6M5Z5S3_9BACT|nr:sigma-70 family RNA polymerase sigma factor [Frigoriglobus tundricola]QJX00771.1 hypothetical protein FTUN_8409 [Frigoriglobus tundricola]